MRTVIRPVMRTVMRPDARASQEQLCTLIGKTLGLQLQSDKAAAAQVGNFLSQKSLLLIIDNFEPFSDHLDLLLPWVQKTKSLQILITSRHILNTQGDINLRLQGLEAPPFADYATTDKLTEKELSQLLRSPCAQILNERARKVWSKFTIDQHNGVAVAKLCSLLQGNPLALELAATLVIDYELDDIYQELTRNYNLLACELQDLPLRQRSIHNSIEYSWQLLPPDLATLLAQCSTLRNTFSYQTVSYITGEPVTKTVQLVFRSLLVTDPQRQLHIHELVRQFAARKLAEMPALFQRAHQQHSTLHISFLRDWWEKKESKHAVAKLLPQLENIYAAWDWAFQQQDFGALSRSTLAMTQFHIHAGLLWDMHVRANGYQQRLHEQISQSNQTKQSSQVSLDSGPIVPVAFQEIQVALNQMRGILHFELSDYETATTLLQQSIEAATKHHYHYLLSNSECTLGNICRLTQRLSEAQQHYERAEQIANDRATTLSADPGAIAACTACQPAGRRRNKSKIPEECRVTPAPISR
jgi:predicted ATPase